MKASVSALWGPKALNDVVALDLDFEVETEKVVLRRLAAHDIAAYTVFVFFKSVQMLTSAADCHLATIGSRL